MPKRGKVDGSFSPSWSTVPYIHLVSITYFSGLCVVLVRQRIKGITHHHPPACIMLGLGGLFVLLGVDSLQVAVGLGAGGQAPPGCLSTEHSVLSLSVLATGRHEHI